MNVHDEVSRALVRVGNTIEGSSRARGDESLSRRETVARKQDEVVLCSSVADRRDDLLDGVGPGLDVGNVVGLVHDAERNLAL